VKNIVAPLGTSLTKEQLEKVSKLTKNVLFLFDCDSAGQKALERAFYSFTRAIFKYICCNHSPI
jgi:DNA primase